MPDPIEDVALVIEGFRWRAWSSIEIKRTIDSFSTFEFTAPYESERIRFRDIFKPFSYKVVTLRINDEQIFTGQLVVTDPAVAPDSRTVHASGYSLPAALNDVTPPASAWPLELNGLKLRRIAETLLQPFGIHTVVDDDDGAPFRRVRIKPDQKILPFLTDLAKQRSLILSDTAVGELRIFKSISSGQPVVSLKQGEPPLISVEPKFSPQEYYSEITGIAKTRSGRGGAKFTVQNPHLQHELRPFAFELEDTDGPDVPAATRAHLGRMFANVLAVTIDLPTWRDPAGALWKPDTLVMLEARDSMITKPSAFLVREVTLRQEANTTTASLELCLPGAFSGEVPAVLPWD